VLTPGTNAVVYHAHCTQTCAAQETIDRRQKQKSTSPTINQYKQGKHQLARSPHFVLPGSCVQYRSSTLAAHTAGQHASVDSTTYSRRPTPLSTVGFFKPDCIATCSMRRSGCMRPTEREATTEVACSNALSHRIAWVLQCT